MAGDCLAACDTPPPARCAPCRGSFERRFHTGDACSSFCDRQVHVSQIDCATGMSSPGDFWVLRARRLWRQTCLGLPGMTFGGHLAKMAAPFFMTGLVGGCGAKTLAGNAEPGRDSGTSRTAGGSVCVDIEVASPDVSCGNDSDCTLSLSGHLCNGQCSCGDTPVNAGAAARYRSETESLTFEACPCADPGEARCLGGQCARCGLGPNQPAGCSDTGISTLEDSGMTIVDGGGPDTACGYPPAASAFDDASNSGCRPVPTGTICAVSNGATINPADGGVTGGTATCRPDCMSSQFQLSCSTDLGLGGTIPEPAATLGCTPLGGPMPSNSIDYCCPCR